MHRAHGKKSDCLGLKYFTWASGSVSSIHADFLALLMLHNMKGTGELDAISRLLFFPH